MELRHHLKQIFRTAGVAAVTGAIVVSAANPGTPGASPVEAAACPSSDFQNVSTYNQTQNYPKPGLTVTCSGNEMTVQSNGIPNFNFVQKTPSALQAQSYTFRIPTNPAIAANPSNIPLLGPVGVAVDGLPIFGPNEAPNDGYGDPKVDGMLDYCNGHTAQRGDYHFHANPVCLSNQDLTAANVNKVVGYAFDGFQIVLPLECADAGCSSVKKVSSSWQKSSNLKDAWKANRYVEGSGDLDMCNGKTGADGQYRYYATESFPYFLGCYNGTAAPNNGGGQPGANTPNGGRPGNMPGGNLPANGGNGNQPGQNPQASPGGNGQPGNGAQGPQGPQRPRRPQGGNPSTYAAPQPGNPAVQPAQGQNPFGFLGSFFGSLFH